MFKNILSTLLLLAIVHDPIYVVGKNIYHDRNSNPELVDLIRQMDQKKYNIERKAVAEQIRKLQDIINLIDQHKDILEQDYKELKNTKFFNCYKNFLRQVFTGPVLDSKDPYEPLISYSTKHPVKTNHIQQEHEKIYDKILDLIGFYKHGELKKEQINFWIKVDIVKYDYDVFSQVWKTISTSPTNIDTPMKLKAIRIKAIEQTF